MSSDSKKFKKLFVDQARKEVRLIVRYLSSSGENKSVKLEDVVRAAHTLKGQSFVMEYASMSAFAGELESTFRKVEEGKLVLDDTKTKTLEALVDDLSSSVEAIADSRKAGSLSSQISKLKKLN